MKLLHTCDLLRSHKNVFNVFYDKKIVNVIRL